MGVQNTLAATALPLPLRPEPYIDPMTLKNVTALVGKSAYLSCRVRNLANKTVSYSCEIFLHPRLGRQTIGTRDVVRLCDWGKIINTSMWDSRWILARRPIPFTHQNDGIVLVLFPFDARRDCMVHHKSTHNCAHSSFKIVKTKKRPAMGSTKKLICVGFTRQVKVLESTVYSAKDVYLYRIQSSNFQVSDFLSCW